MRSTRRLDGASVVTVTVPFHLTREQCAAALLMHPSYDPNVSPTRQRGMWLIRESLQTDPNAVRAWGPGTGPAWEAALADVDRWHLITAPQLVL